MCGKVMCVIGVVAALDHLGLDEGMNHRKPLLSAIGGVQGRMTDFKERVRIFYFEVPHHPIIALSVAVG